VNIDLRQNGRAATAKLCAAGGNILREVMKLIVGWNKVSTCSVILPVKLQNVTRQICNICILGKHKKTLEENS